MAFHDIDDLDSLPYSVRVRREARLKAEAAEKAEIDEIYESMRTAKVRKPAFTEEKWQHSDPEVQKSTPDAVYEGDTLSLQAKVIDIPDGAGIDIHIRDTTNWKDLTTIHGRVAGQAIAIDWKAQLPNGFAPKTTYGFEPFYNIYPPVYGKTINFPLKTKTACTVFEITDDHFVHLGTLPALDGKGVLIGTLAGIVAHAANFPDQKLVLFGHATPETDPSFNRTNALLRAQAVKALLENDASAWLEAAEETAPVDIQRLLAGFAAYGWDCAPGALDGKLGPVSKKAIANFKTEYNTRTSKNIPVTDKPDDDFFKTILDAIETMLTDELKKRLGSKPRPKLGYGFEGKGVYGCTDSFPVSTVECKDRQSKGDRRVEAVFYNANELPQIKAAENHDKIQPHEATVYNPRFASLVGGVKAAAVAEHKPGVPVALFEYPYAHESKLDSKGIPAKLFKDLCEHHEIPILTPTRTGPVLVKEKWAYVFSKQGSSTTLVYECKPVATGEKQTFEFVSWAEADKEANQKAYPRPTKGGSKDLLALPPDREYFLVLSQMQLPLARIDFYTQHSDALAKRALHIPANALKAGADPVSLYLTDYIGVAYYLREQYDKHVKSYEAYAGNKEQAQRRYLAGLVCAVAKSKPRLKGWLDYSAVEKECAQSEQETKERLKGKASAEAHLRDWKLSGGFEVTRFDYSGTKQVEEAILAHDQALTSEDEIEYLTIEAEKKGSWYNTIFEPDSKFVFFRKLETLSSTKAFWELLSKHIIGRALANFGPTKFKGVLTVEALVQKQETFLGELHQIIEHAKITFPDLVQNKGKWFFVQIDERTKLPFIDYDFKASKQISGQVHTDTGKYRTVKRKCNEITEHAKAATPALQRVLIGIEAVNLANAVYCAFKADTAKDRIFSTVSAIGSAADMLASFEHIGKQRVTDWRQGTGATAKEAAAFTERAFARITLAGAICDYVGALKDVYEASAKGHNGVAAGYATIALAAYASGTSAALTLTSVGVETAATAFGIGATAFGVIGIALFVVGAGVVWYFSDSDLHEWADKSAWAKNPAQAGSIEHQTAALHHILCEFTADSYLLENQLPGTEYFTASGSVLHKHEYLLTVRVRPGYFNDHSSKYHVGIQVTREGGVFGTDKVILDKKVVLPATQARKLRNQQDEDCMVLTHRFSAQEFGSLENVQEDTFTYTLTAKLDFHGDGSAMLFDVKNKGALKVRGSDV